MKKSDEALLHNFSSILTEVGRLNGSVFVKRDGYSMVKATGSAWPNVVFDIDTDAVNAALIESLIADVRENEIQPLMLCEDNAALTAACREKGFMPIDRWLGMHIEARSVNAPADRNYPGLTVSLVEKGSDISAWAKVVSKILFNSKHLNEDVFTGLSKSGAEMVVARLNDEITGTTLIYYDDTGTAGLYMVGVTEEYRGKGIGRMLLDFSMQRILKRGKNLCVLHSTKKGLSLYTHYGFEAGSNYNLLYKFK